MKLTTTLLSAACVGCIIAVQFRFEPRADIAAIRAETAALHAKNSVTIGVLAQRVIDGRNTPAQLVESIESIYQLSSDTGRLRPDGNHRLRPVDAPESALIAFAASAPAAKLIPRMYHVQPPDWVGYYVQYQWEPATRPSAATMTRWLLEPKPTFTVSIPLDTPMLPGDFGQIVTRWMLLQQEYLRLLGEWQSCDRNGDGRVDGDDIQRAVELAR